MPVSQLGALVLLLALASPLPARADAALATGMGCVNCHGQPLRADAPSFARLAQKYAKRRTDGAAEPHVVEELLHGEPWRRIPAHEHLSPETARRLVHWLFDGAAGAP